MARSRNRIPGRRKKHAKASVNKANPEKSSKKTKHGKHRSQKSSQSYVVGSFVKHEQGYGFINPIDPKRKIYILINMKSCGTGLCMGHYQGKKAL
jgi:hypothetical protein